MDKHDPYEKKVLVRLDRILRRLDRIVELLQPRKPERIIVRYSAPQKE